MGKRGGSGVANNAKGVAPIIVKPSTNAIKLNSNLVSNMKGLKNATPNGNVQKVVSNGKSVTATAPTTNGNVQKVVSNGKSVTATASQNSSEEFTIQSVVTNDENSDWMFWVGVVIFVLLIFVILAATMGGSGGGGGSSYYRTSYFGGWGGGGNRSTTTTVTVRKKKT
jgi:ATP-dependent Zn protease